MRITTRTTMLNREKTLLIVLLLTTYLFTFAVGQQNQGTSFRRCVSENGRSSTVCRESQYCCDDENGMADCCTNVGAIVGAVVGFFSLLILTLVTFCICIYCCRKYNSNKNSTTAYSTTTARRRVVATRRQTTILQTPFRETSPNQVPLSHSDSNTNNIEAPPPYPAVANNRPPSYSEV